MTAPRAPQQVSGLGDRVFGLVHREQDAPRGPGRVRVARHARQVIGEREGIDPELLALIEEAEGLTAANDRLTLVVAFNYGSRFEIAKAARKLAEKAARGAIDPATITPETFAAELDTSGIPDPDLVIRTSGEIRLSNFLLWQAAYAELVFMDAYWPEFGRELFAQALAEYRSRDRRYGGLSTRSHSMKAQQS